MLLKMELNCILSLCLIIFSKFILPNSLCHFLRLGNNFTCIYILACLMLSGQSQSELTLNLQIFAGLFYKDI